MFSPAVKLAMLRASVLARNLGVPIGALGLPDGQTQREREQAASDAKRGVGAHVVTLSESPDALRCPETQEKLVAH